MDIASVYLAALMGISSECLSLGFLWKDALPCAGVFSKVLLRGDGM
jgi:hypothetical protein